MRPWKSHLETPRNYALTRTKHAQPINKDSSYRFIHTHRILVLHNPSLLIFQWIHSSSSFSTNIVEFHLMPMSCQYQPLHSFHMRRFMPKTIIYNSWITSLMHIYLSRAFNTIINIQASINHFKISETTTQSHCLAQLLAQAEGSSSGKRLSLRRAPFA